MDLDEWRRHRYTVNTLALGRGDVDGAPGLFDSALTNGLLAAVTHDWPGEEGNAKGRTLSANQLLGVVREKVSSSTWSVDQGPHPATVDLDVLAQEIVDTQAARHGRAGGHEVVSPAAVAALHKLDSHPALGVLTNAHIDREEVNDARARAVEEQRVTQYMALIGDEELDRRAARAEEALPFDPKDRYSSMGIGECPVCWRDALIVEEELHYGTQLGTCVACSYVYTERLARDAEFERMLEYHHDD